jgi:transcriptional regulator with XRE-family HTH domain
MSVNRAGELIRDTRSRRGWSFGDLARACGASSSRAVSKLSLRLVRIEREQRVPERKLALRVAALLDLDIDDFRRVLGEQRREEQLLYESWLNEAVAIELYVVPFAGFSYRQRLPEGCDELEAFRLPKQMTAGRELRVIVAVSRRLSFVFQRGKVVDRLEARSGHSVVPAMRIGRSIVQFEAE